MRIKIRLPLILAGVVLFALATISPVPWTAYAGQFIALIVVLTALEHPLLRRVPRHDQRVEVAGGPRTPDEVAALLGGPATGRSSPPRTWTAAVGLTVIQADQVVALLAAHGVEATRRADGRVVARRLLLWPAAFLPIFAAWRLVRDAVVPPEALVALATIVAGVAVALLAYLLIDRLLTRRNSWTPAVPGAASPAGATPGEADGGP